jgi:hypothetical protein
MTYRGIKMETKNFNFQTIAKFDLIPLCRVRAEEGIETGSTFDESVNKRVVNRIFKPRRLDVIKQDVDGFISACIEHDIKKLGLYAERSRDIDGLIRVISSYLKDGMAFKHDNVLNVHFDEDGQYVCEPYMIEIDEWPFKTRVMPRAGLVQIDGEYASVVTELEEFDRNIQRK